MGHPDRALAVAAGLGVLLGGGPAFGFCRTTTCDAGGNQTGCEFDAGGCSLTGLPLYWPERCLSFAVEGEGSPKLGIPSGTLEPIVQTAFVQWTRARCAGGQPPSFDIEDYTDDFGPAACGEPEFNKTAANASIWMFRDGDWPYAGAANTLALTTVSFEVPTGKILDADVEMNSFLNDFSTSDQVPGADLASIVTHEAGHFLGLSHSQAFGATMSANYPTGSRDFRSLADDDAAGICAVYPPDRDVGECAAAIPWGGYSRFCGGVNPSIAPPPRSAGSRAARGGGCTVTEPGGSGGVVPLLAALAALASIRRRRSCRS